MISSMIRLTKTMILCATLIASACEERTVAAQGGTAKPTTCVSGSAGPYRVARVSDADTIAVRISGRKPALVRLIGVDAPEVEGPYRREERHGVEAQAFARELLEGRAVFLESDPEQESHDQYGRILAYVHRADDCLMVNGEIIRQGHAESYRRFRFRHRSLFARYEQEARINRRGMWSN